MRHGTTGDFGDRLLHLGGRYVRACRLDHRTPTADEVDEPVAVTGHQVPGVEPAVSVERFFATAFVIALHQAAPADAQLTECAVLDQRPSLWIDDLGFHARCGFAKRPTSMFRDRKSTRLNSS